MALSSRGGTEESELYCWPCFGIIANIANDDIREGDNCGGYWMRKFSEFKPIGIETFLDATDEVVVRFDSNWSGFRNAMEFDKSFEARNRGRDEWIRRKTSPGSRIYGWIARENDYKSEGALGCYLRCYGALKTVPELIQEASADRKKVLDNLICEVNTSTVNLMQLRTSYIQKKIPTREMYQEHDKIYSTVDKVLMKLQTLEPEHVRGVVEEQDMMRFESENKRRRLDRTKDLNEREEALVQREKRVAEIENFEMELRRREEELIGREKQILVAESIKNDLIKNVLQMTTEERRQADENAKELMEVKQREKQAVEKVLELERNEQRGLESGIEEVKDELNDIRSSYQALLVKERQCNDELQGAREELIKGLNGMQHGHRAKLGVKRMGEIDSKEFIKKFRHNFPLEDADYLALKLCSFWQEKLKNPHWHPYRVVETEKGIHQKLLNEDDEQLRGLKNEWGDEIHDAVVTALKELHEYNPSGCYMVYELWNFKENRQASFKEVISHICFQLKTLKRKKF